MNKTILFVAMLALSLALQSQRPIERTQVLADEAWMQEYRAFIPDPAMLQNLDQRLAQPARIDVYFAFWCGDSKREVPRFLKIVDGLANKANLEIHFFEVERKANPQQKYYVESAGVERIASFVCYRQGKEIGRIVETPRQSLLEDLLTIFF